MHLRGSVFLLFSISFASYFLYPLLFSRSTKNPFRRQHLFERVCPETGPDSAAPINYVEVSLAITKAIQRIKSRDSNAIIISTTVNREAAKQNLPYFLKSLAAVVPPLLSNTIVFCLDKASCERCASLHVDPLLCLYMDLAVSEESLAPLLGSKDFRARSYWRLTYGRVFATLMIHNEGVSVLPVDVDAVFLKNPFLIPGEILEHPHSIAGVIDSEPFHLSTTNESLLLNGGFLYFPATTAKAAISTNNVLRNIWKQSCTAQNEQLVTTTVLKELYKSAPKDDMNKPRILNHEKFINFCSTNCGTVKFREILSLADLHDMENEMKNVPEFKICTKEYRKNWIFFHAACTNWPGKKSKDLAKAKGSVQRAVMEWVEESRRGDAVAR